MAEKTTTYPSATAFMAIPVSPQKNGMMPPSKEVESGAPVPMAMAAPGTPQQGLPQVPAEPERRSPRRRCCRFVIRTLKLFPFHALNFVLGTAAFCVVVTGVCLAGGLIPLCCLGVAVYMALLYVVQWLAYVDVAMANAVTPKRERVQLLPTAAPNTNASGLQLAADLNKVSFRSTLAIVYFLTIKFAFGIISIVLVSLPFASVGGHVVYTFADDQIDKVQSYASWWDDSSFNYSTHPFWFTLASIAVFVIGIALMHLFAIVSRHMTRAICCEKVVEGVPQVQAQAQFVFATRV